MDLTPKLEWIVGSVPQVGMLASACQQITDQGYAVRQIVTGLEVSPLGRVTSVYGVVASRERVGLAEQES